MAWARSNISLNGLRIPAMKFPGGEINVKLEDISVPRHSAIEAVLRSSDDLITLALVVDAARRSGARHIKLLMPYIPYARQDRVINDGEAHSVTVVANIVNSMSFDEVAVFDPHSDVSAALIKNVRVIGADELMLNLPKDSLGDIFVSPRAGAERRVRRCGHKFQIPVAYCSKARDPVTGVVTKTYLDADLVVGRYCMIVDDICDSGDAFVSLARLLRDFGALDVNLFVTHGIFSKGFAPFAGLISTVYFTNSLRQEPRCDPFAINIWRDQTRS